MAADKILWVVNYNKVQDFLAQAVAVGATGVAIRTDNDLFRAIGAFHPKGIKVFGWRWPSANRDPAMKEAAKVVDLLGQGLDGYYVDPEGEPGKPYDWNQSGLETLADDFCKAIRKAAPDKPLGVTSHYKAKTLFPKLPWATFFKHATVLLPQAYWRVAGGEVGHGLPADNYEKSIEFWTKAGSDAAKIVPMAGELGVVTGAEIGVYAKAAADAGGRPLHFYNWSPSVKQSVWDAIAKL